MVKEKAVEDGEGPVDDELELRPAEEYKECLFETVKLIEMLSSYLDEHTGSDERHRECLKRTHSDADIVPAYIIESPSRQEEQKLQD